MGSGGLDSWVRVGSGEAGARGVVEMQAGRRGDAMVGLDCCCLNPVFLRLVRWLERQGGGMWWWGRLRDLPPRDAREKSLLAWEETKLLYETMLSLLLSMRLARYS
jgi:hypothetical protein